MDYSQFKDEEIERAFKQAFLESLEIARKTLPYKTGNLAYNALKWRRKNNIDIEIYIDDSIASYVDRLDELKKNGMPKASYGFWGVFSEVFVETLRKILKEKFKEVS